MKALLLALLVGCVEQPTGPVVQLTASDHLQEYMDGAAQWWRLGFAVQWESSQMPECSPTWYEEGVIDCQITINIQRLYTGSDGLADRATRTIFIDPQWDSWALLALSAHEVGHVLLNTGKHTDPGVRAVMAARGAEWDLQPADYELACQSIGVCLGTL